MTEAEAFQLVGTLFGAWLLGYGPAFTIRYVKQLTEKI
jgi:hypothetical protein